MTHRFSQPSIYINFHDVHLLDEENLLLLLYIDENDEDFYDDGEPSTMFGLKIRPLEALDEHGLMRDIRMSDMGYGLSALSGGLIALGREKRAKYIFLKCCHC